jgi:hypothetical protein
MAHHAAMLGPALEAASRIWSCIEAPMRWDVRYLGRRSALLASQFHVRDMQSRGWLAACRHGSRVQLCQGHL